MSPRAIEVHRNQPDGTFGAEMLWDALDPDKYYYFSGANLMRRNLAAQTNTTMKTFPSTLEANGGSLNIQSRDGRYFTVRYGGTNKVWDSQTDTIYSGEVTPLDSTGWVSITPDGKYMVTAAGNTAQPQKEHYSYPINHGTIPPKHWQHPDAVLGLVWRSRRPRLGVNGKNYFVTFECHDSLPSTAWTSPSIKRGATPAQQRAANQQLVPLTFNDSGHFSAVSKGPLSDWVFAATEAFLNSDDFNSGIGGWTAYKQEIIAMNVVTLEVQTARPSSVAPIGCGL